VLSTLDDTESSVVEVGVSVDDDESTVEKVIHEKVEISKVEEKTVSVGVATDDDVSELKVISDIVEISKVEETVSVATALLSVESTGGL